MLTEQPIAELAGLRALFPGPQLEMTVASILEGNTLARLWADDGGHAMGPGQQRLLSEPGR
jgi:hypothetical protein